MTTITDAMIHAAERVMCRHTVAERQEIEAADVTEDAIDAEFAEVRQIDEAERDDDPSRASLDDIFAEMLEAALNAPIERDPDPANLDGLTKLTVNITARAEQALVTAADARGDTRTDAVSRALRIYELIATSEPGTRFTVDDITVTVGS